MRHKFNFLLPALLIFSLLITPVGTAFAATNYVQDPSLEAAYTSTAIWQQTSTNSGSPLCIVADCDNDGGTAGPRTGLVWAWFGGIDFSDPDYTSPENSSLSQNVTFPNSCGVQLQFYLWIGKAPTGSGVDDVLNAKVDNATVFSANATQKTSYPSYTLVTVDLLPSLANGGVHTLRFDSTTAGQMVNFNVDDISVVSLTCFTISGNAGTPGATLSYAGTTSGSTTADGSGNYSFSVPAGWSGTVIPSKTNFTFSPSQRTYTPVAADQSGQDYTATLITYTISGNAGTSGATLTYTGTTSGSATANGSGNYSFTVPAGWSGTVTPSKIGFIFSPPERTYTAVAANQTGQDYTAFTGFTISGNVGLSRGVTLSYTDGTPKMVTSRPDGSYSIPVHPGWSGTVTPSHPCYGFTPPNRPYTNVTSDKTNQNYTPASNNSPTCGVKVGVYRPSNGLLFLKNTNTTGIADVAINYGIPGDYPVTGDWDGNGTDTIGVYRNGTFYLRNSNTVGFADIVFPFGLPGDQPVAGDWDGNGTDTVGVYRNGTFFLRNSNSNGIADISFGLGIPGDVGIAGDWNNDGMDTTGVFRPSNGVIFLKNANSTGFADVAINYGIPGDKPVIGDWNNDGIDTIGVYRNGTFYLRNTNTVVFADV